MMFIPKPSALWHSSVALLALSHIALAADQPVREGDYVYRCGRRCKIIKAKIQIISEQLNLANHELQELWSPWMPADRKPIVDVPEQPPSAGTGDQDPIHPTLTYIKPTNPLTVTKTSTATSTSTSSALPTETMSYNESSGFRSVAYFTNWGIYGRGYTADKIPADKLTHILYAFADNRNDGEVFLTDKWSDIEKHWDGDSWQDTGNNLYGNLKQLFLLKKANRNLKILLSIGGWTYTNTNRHLDEPAATEEGRRKFAATCVNLIKDLGFDGIDLDWEYPKDTNQGEQMYLLLKEVRKAMDDYANHLEKSHPSPEGKAHFALSIAAPAGKSNYQNIPLDKVSSVLDFINLMGYDYSGAWDKTAGHQANMFHSDDNPDSTPFNTDTVINDYLAAGVPSDKIVLGMPLYGRAFQNTDGPGKPFQGTGEGSWENGIWDYKNLPTDGPNVFYDSKVGASYSYDKGTRTMISYDTPEMARVKAQWVIQKKLGGAMWWELNGDRDKSDEDGGLINVVYKQLAGQEGNNMETQNNWLYYPDTQYENLKKGFA